MSESKGRSLSVQFSEFLHKQESKIASALPAHITSGRMVSATMAAFNASADLQKCATSEAGRISIIQSVMVAATVGLEPGVLGQAYLIPYKNKSGDFICTFVPGWKGIISVIGRSGKAMARANAVFQGDDFDWDVGTGMFIRHKPQAKDRNPAKITHVYAIGEVAGLADRVIEVWSIEQVREHLDRFNKVGDKHYAKNPKNWEMYARKVPLLQVAKYLPQTVEITNVVAAAYTAERNENLVVDEYGVPLNAGYQDDDNGRPVKPEIKQPRRRGEAQDAVPKRQPGSPENPFPAHPPELASEGQIKWLKNKAGDGRTLRGAITRAGVEIGLDLAGLTLDGFQAIKEALK